MRRGALIVLAVSLSAAAVLYAQQKPRAIPLDEVFRAGAGRYAVVNPTPEFAKNAMLLDTTTGETWITCQDSGRMGWCAMFRSNDLPSFDPATSGPSYKPGDVRR